MLYQVNKDGKIVHVTSEPSGVGAEEAVAQIKSDTKRGEWFQILPIPYPEEPVLRDDGQYELDTDGNVRMHIAGYVHPDVGIFTHYHNKKGELAERPKIPPLVKTEIRADGKDFVPIICLPDPVTIYVDGEPYEVTGGRLDFTAEEPGRYKIEFRWPVQDFHGEIVAK
jgi:hypothetical protein